MPSSCLWWLQLFQNALAIETNDTKAVHVVIFIPTLAALFLSRIFSRAVQYGVLCCFAFLLLTPVTWAESQGPKKTVLVELFTSQGCSSCPPADAVLRELADKAQRENLAIYPLSFHVDYWNYLGWKDPHSAATATRRQYAYRKAFGRSDVYTPQAVINGVVQLNGANRSKMLGEVMTELKNGQDSARLRVSLSKATPKELELRYRQPRKKAILFVAYLTRDTKNAVTAGENSGATLSHTNVVQQLDAYPIAAATSKERALVQYIRRQIALRRAASQEKPIVIYVQEAQSMKVLGVQALELYIDGEK